MVITCYVCKWRGNKEPRRSFHKFPSDKDAKQAWLDAMGKSDAVVGTRTSICSLHFTQNCFRYGLICGTQILKKGSLPTLHLSGTKGACIIEESIADDHNYSVISIDSNACGKSDASITLSSPNEICDNTEAIERLGEPIEVGIEDQQCTDDKPEDDRSNCKSRSTNVPEVKDLQQLLNQRNFEIIILNRRVQRLQRNASTLKAANKNLRSRVKQVEKEVKLLRTNLVRARKKNETKKSTLSKQ